MSTQQDDMERLQYWRRLRDTLRAARERLGLDQVDVGRMVAERLTPRRETPYGKSTISMWESYQRHPGIDELAAWANVLGMRLVVELDDAEGSRVPVLLDPDTADIARSIDLLDDEDREYIRQTVRRTLAASKPPVEPRRQR